jgi:hypothetical protein
MPASTADTSTTAAAQQQLQQLQLQQQPFQPLPLLAPSPMRTTAPLSILTMSGSSNNIISGSSSSAASSSYGASGTTSSLIAEYGSEGSRSRASTPEPVDISTRPFFVTVAQVHLHSMLYYHQVTIATFCC